MSGSDPSPGGGRPFMPMATKPNRAMAPDNTRLSSVSDPSREMLSIVSQISERCQPDTMTAILDAFKLRTHNAQPAITSACILTHRSVRKDHAKEKAAT